MCAYYARESPKTKEDEGFWTHIHTHVHSCTWASVRYEHNNNKYNTWKTARDNERFRRISRFLTRFRSHSGSCCTLIYYYNVYVMCSSIWIYVIFTFTQHKHIYLTRNLLCTHDSTVVVQYRCRFITRDNDGYRTSYPGTDRGRIEDEEGGAKPPVAKGVTTCRIQSPFLRVQNIGNIITRVQRKYWIIVSFWATHIWQNKS